MYDSGSTYKLLDEGVGGCVPKDGGETMSTDDLYPDDEFFDKVRNALKEYHESVTPEQFFDDLRKAAYPRETYHDYLVRVSKEREGGKPSE